MLAGGRVNILSTSQTSILGFNQCVYLLPAIYLLYILTMILPRESIGCKISFFSSPRWRNNDIMWKSHGAIIVNEVPLEVLQPKNLGASVPAYFGLWPSHDAPSAFLNNLTPIWGDSQDHCTALHCTGRCHANKWTSQIIDLIGREGRFSEMVFIPGEIAICVFMWKKFLW